MIHRPAPQHSAKVRFSVPASLGFGLLIFRGFDFLRSDHPVCYPHGKRPVRVRTGPGGLRSTRRGVSSYTVQGRHARRCVTYCGTGNRGEITKRSHFERREATLDRPLPAGQADSPFTRRRTSLRPRTPTHQRGTAKRNARWKERVGTVQFAAVKHGVPTSVRMSAIGV